MHGRVVALRGGAAHDVRLRLAGQQEVLVALVVIPGVCLGDSPSCHNLPNMQVRGRRFAGLEARSCAIVHATDLYF